MPEKKKNQTKNRIIHLGAFFKSYPYFVAQSRADSLKYSFD